MATFSLDIPDISVERVISALCTQSGYLPPSPDNGMQAVKDFIVRTVSSVEQQAAIAAAQASVVTPPPVVLQVDLSTETLVFLRDLLKSQTLSVGAPDFTTTVPVVVAALAELDAAIQHAS